jgi:glycine hydroxymethyltransferase
VAQETEDIDYDQARDLAREHRPKMIICGGSAIPRLIDFKAFREIADEVGAILMVDAAHFIGLVAGKAIPSPVPYADVVTFTTHKVLRGPRGGMLVCKEEHAAKLDKAVVPMMQGGPLMHGVAAKAVALKEALSPDFKAYQGQIVKNAKALAATLMGEGWRLVSGGTDNHLMLIDVFAKGITGKVAEKALDRAGITVNKNTIPFDTNSPMVASGIRVGTPALTTRGMKEPEMEKVGLLISRALSAVEDDTALADVKRDVKCLCDVFPLYAARLEAYDAALAAHA